MEKTILIIEDEQDLREAMSDVLIEAGFLVTTAVNGEEGLTRAKTNHPDLILLDLMMPVMNGHEMLHALRSDEWGKTAKVIILTAMDDVNNIATAHEGAILDYFIKAHMSLEDLLKKVRVLIYSQE